MTTNTHVQDLADSLLLWHYEFSERLMLGLAVVGVGASTSGASQRWLALWWVSFVLLATGWVIGRSYQSDAKCYWIPTLGSQLVVSLVSWLLISRWVG